MQHKFIYLVLAGLGALAWSSTRPEVASPVSVPEVQRGVHYVPLEQQQLPAEWKAHLREQLRNLRETGSMSRGKITHEFSLMGSMSASLRRKGWEKLMSQLAIQPSDLRQVLGTSFVLVGADVQGTEIEGRGAAGFFQVLRHPTTGQLIELSENQLDVLMGDGIAFSPEFQNDRVGQIPATLEQLADSDGAAVHNLQWAARNRTFHLTTKGLPADEVRRVAQEVTQRLVAMPFDGWRRPYDYDPENPLHRIARPPTTDRGRW